MHIPPGGPMGPQQQNGQYYQYGYGPGGPPVAPPDPPRSWGMTVAVIVLIGLVLAVGWLTFPQWHNKVSFLRGGAVAVASATASPTPPAGTGPAPAFNPAGATPSASASHKATPAEWRAWLKSPAGDAYRAMTLKVSALQDVAKKLQPILKSGSGVGTLALQLRTGANGLKSAADKVAADVSPPGGLDLLLAGIQQLNSATKSFLTTADDLNDGSPGTKKAFAAGNTSINKAVDKLDTFDQLMPSPR